MMKSACLLMGLALLPAAAFAGTIEITASDAGDGRLSIGYNVVDGDDLPAGFLFHVVLDNGAQIESVLYANPAFPLSPSTVTYDGVGGIHDYGDVLIQTVYEAAVPVFTRPVPPFGQDPADFNQDGVINNDDGAMVLAEWGVAGWSHADLNGDAFVDLVDYCIVAGSDPDIALADQLLLLQLAPGANTTTTISIHSLANYGPAVANSGLAFDAVLPEPVSVVVPEPATLTLLALGVLVLRRRK